MKNTSFTALEPRVLFSGTGDATPTPVDPAVQAADRAQITLDVSKMTADLTSANATLTAARQMRDAHAKSLVAQVKTLNVAVTADAAALKTMHLSAEAQVKVVLAKYKATIGAGELDVKTNTEGETEQERADDRAKLDAARAARLAELKAIQTSATSATLETKLKTDRAAVEAARKTGEAQSKLDAAAVSAAEKARATVFQTDRKVVEMDLAKFRKDGGNVDALHLVLPKLEASVTATHK